MKMNVVHDPDSTPSHKKITYSYNSLFSYSRCSAALSNSAFFFSRATSRALGDFLSSLGLAAERRFQYDHGVFLSNRELQLSHLSSPVCLPTFLLHALSGSYLCLLLLLQRCTWRSHGGLQADVLQIHCIDESTMVSREHLLYALRAVRRRVMLILLGPHLLRPLLQVGPVQNGLVKQGRGH